jgi:hypothetical protein
LDGYKRAIFFSTNNGKLNAIAFSIPLPLNRAINHSRSPPAIARRSRRVQMSSERIEKNRLKRNGMNEERTTKKKKEKKKRKKKQQKSRKES